MKILQVCPRYPPQTGGVETHVGEISERLVDRGHEIEVHTADAGLEGQRRERHRGVDVRRHRGLAPGGAFYVAPTIVRAVRQSTADVVHAHNYHSSPLLFAAIGISGERFVATPHYHGASPNRTRNLLLGAYRPIGRRALGRADAVVAVSDWERSRLADDLGVDPTVVPNGVDVQRFAGAEPEARDRPYLLCVGRLEPYKGIQHAIRALPDLEGYDLVIVGTGSYRPGLEEIARHAGVAGRVTFLSTVEHARLPSLYAGASACLVLSAFEAYGMAVAEALATGTPCVVRDEMALSDWTSTPGVVGIGDMEPAVVAGAVRVAVDTAPVEVELPTWDDHVARLERYYKHPDGKA